MTGEEWFDALPGDDLERMTQRRISVLSYEAGIAEGMRRANAEHLEALEQDAHR